MNPAELLDARADLLLQEATTQGKGATLFSLEGIAGAMLPDVSPEDRRAAVNEALKRANRGERTAPPPGYVPPAERKVEKPRRSPAAAKRSPPPAARNGGIPNRTPPGPPKKVAERSIAPAVESWNPTTLRAFLREQLLANPDLKTRELWAAACKVRQPHVSEASFGAMYAPEARKALREEAAPAAAASSAPEAQPEGELPAATEKRGESSGWKEAAKGKPGAGSSVAGPAPEPTGALNAENGSAIGADAKVSGAETEIGAEAEAAPRPSASLVMEAGTGHPEERLPGFRPGVVEISGGGDSFRTTRGDDGAWSVELRARVDDARMHQLAAVLWQQVVGVPRATA